MADSTTNIQQITAGANADVRVNENFDAASPAMLYGRRAETTTGLTWGYYGGRYNSTSISNGTVSLTGSTTNYIVAAKSNGAVSVSTSTTNWNNSASYERLYLVVTGASSITSYQDHRNLMGGGFFNPMTTAGDIITGGSSGIAQRLGAGTDGQILKVVSGAPAWADPAPGGSASGYDTATPAAGAIDLSDETIAVWIVNLNANVTSITLPTALTGEALSLLLLFVQDGTGGRTVAGWPSITWEAGSAPTITSTAGAITSVPILVLGNGDVYGVS